MPNHITNILTIEGDEVLVQKCLSEIKGQDEDQFIDFNKIVPMPTELEGTKSPITIISQAEYDEQEARIAKGELTEMEKQYGVSRGITKEISDRLNEEHGANNWYNWRLENWGTKWNAYSQHYFGDNQITFDTAWSNPSEVIDYLSVKYPELTFHMAFADEDFGHNVGKYTYQNGEVIEQDIPEGGTIEAYRMVIEIKGDEDYYLIDYLCNDAEEDNDFSDNMIQLAHEEDYLEEGYPMFVLTRLKELALAEEKYERVAEIDKLIQGKVEEVDQNEE
jgi:hypothetical protein